MNDLAWKQYNIFYAKMAWIFTGDCSFCKKPRSFDRFNSRWKKRGSGWKECEKSDIILCVSIDVPGWKRKEKDSQTKREREMKKAEKKGMGSWRYIWSDMEKPIGIKQD